MSGFLCAGLQTFLPGAILKENRKGDAPVKIFTLMENTSGDEYLHCEHGLSLHIETDCRKLLFDAGQTADFAENAKNMGVDLSRVDTAILSHGHYDHSGGFAAFRSLNPHAPVYASSYAFGDFYNGTEKYIGVDPALKDLPGLVLSWGEVDLGDGITLYAGRIPLPRGIESYGLHVRTNGRPVADDFRHEQYLLIREGEKRVLFSGCSHRGILNIAEYFRPDVLVGGFHFMKLDPAGEGRPVLENAARSLLELGCTFYTGHCTGLAQFAFLKERMGGKLHYLAAGSILEL